MNYSSPIAERLRRHTLWLTKKFIERASEFKGQTGFRSMIRRVGDTTTFNTLLSKGEYILIGIDGSMDYDERLEMLLFYICATAYRCPIRIDKDIHIDTSKVERDSKISLSSAVPLLLEDISNVLESSTTETDFKFEYRLKSIPFTLMTLGELSIALDVLESRDDILAIFLDRSLFATFNISSRDLRLLLNRNESPLVGFPTNYGRLSMLDINIASRLGAGNIYIPRREPYLVYAAIQILLGNSNGSDDNNDYRCEEVGVETLAKRLGFDDKGMKRVIKGLKRLDKRYDGQLIDRMRSDCNSDDISSIKLRDEVRDYWKRVMEVVGWIRRNVFHGSSDDKHPLIYNDRWLTLYDLNTINTFIIYELFNRSVEKNVIVVGITKDTSASDYTRSVIPFALYNGMLRISNKPYRITQSDRLFLTMMAAMNSSSIETPWRTISYDVCFTTMVKGNDAKSDNGYINSDSGDDYGNAYQVSQQSNIDIEEMRVSFRAARKHIFRERLFIKSYFQSRRFVTDDAIRSPVFLYDRFYNPNIDKHSVQFRVLERGRSVLIEPYFEGLDTNPLDNLILYILSKSDNPAVLEALGYNQLLYLADKAVKAEIRLMRDMLRGVMEGELDTLIRKEKIFSARRFRDIRRENEIARERESRSESKGYHVQL